MSAFPDGESGLTPPRLPMKDAGVNARIRKPVASKKLPFPGTEDLRAR